MGLEFPTFVSGFNPANPPGSDQRSEGDDHIRNMKQAIKNTFPTGSKAFYFPFAVSQAIAFSIAAADENKLFRVSTAGGPVGINLPAPCPDGWQVTIVKSTADANPILINAPVGTLLSGQYNVVTARRAVPGVPFRIYYDGVQFVVERICRVPIGTLLEFDSATLPPGYEWPNGQVLASAAALYPEYVAFKGSGTTVDVRGRVTAARDALGGAAAGILTALTMVPDGVTNEAVGGLQQTTLNTGQLPIFTPSVQSYSFGGTTQSFTPAGTIAATGTTESGTPAGTIAVDVSASDHAHTFNVTSRSDLTGGAGQTAVASISTTGAGTNVNTTTEDAGTVTATFTGTSMTYPLGASATLTFTGTPMTAPLGANATISVTMNSHGSGNAIANIQPTIALSKILVVE